MRRANLGGRRAREDYGGLTLSKGNGGHRGGGGGGGGSNVEAADCRAAAGARLPRPRRRQRDAAEKAASEAAEPGTPTSSHPAAVEVSDATLAAASGSRPSSPAASRQGRATISTVRFWRERESEARLAEEGRKKEEEEKAAVADIQATASRRTMRSRRRRSARRRIKRRRRSAVGDLAIDEYINIHDHGRRSIGGLASDVKGGVARGAASEDRLAKAAEGRQRSRRGGIYRTLDPAATKVSIHRGCPSDAGCAGEGRKASAKADDDALTTPEECEIAARRCRHRPVADHGARLARRRKKAATIVQKNVGAARREKEVATIKPVTPAESRTSAAVPWCIAEGLAGRRLRSQGRRRD